MWTAPRCKECINWEECELKYMFHIRREVDKCIPYPYAISCCKHNAHVDTWVAGPNFQLIELTGEECGVSPYAKECEPMKTILITSAATAYTQLNLNQENLSFLSKSCHGNCGNTSYQLTSKWSAMKPLWIASLVSFWLPSVEQRIDIQI